MRPIIYLEKYSKYLFPLFPDFFEYSIVHWNLEEFYLRCLQVEGKKNIKHLI